jgi:hypothetical protein
MGNGNEANAFDLFCDRRRIGVLQRCVIRGWPRPRRNSWNEAYRPQNSGSAEQSERPNAIDGFQEKEASKVEAAPAGWRERRSFRTDPREGESARAFPFLF